MKLKYLGTAAAEGVPALFCECENCQKARAAGGRNIRTRSQALVNDELLIDFPADTYMHMLLHNVPLYRIKSCILTHSHSDHLYTADISMRKENFGHRKNPEIPLTFYSAKSGYDMITDQIAKGNIPENVAQVKLVTPFEPFETEGYTITPLEASHDPKSSPVVYLIEKDDKVLFYSNDTSEYFEPSMNCLRNFKKHIDLISLDCTSGCNHTEYIGHMSLERCIALREKLLEEGIADEKTVFVLHHFSHNGLNSNYDEFVPIAASHNFLVSYDGMEIEF